MVQIKDGYIQPSVIVDVKNVPELNRLEWSEEKALQFRCRCTGYDKIVRAILRVAAS